MDQRRLRQESRERQCSSLGHCGRGQAHGLQSKRMGQVVQKFRCRRRWDRGLWRNPYFFSTEALESQRGLQQQRFSRIAASGLAGTKGEHLLRSLDFWIYRPCSRARQNQDFSPPSLCLRCAWTSQPRELSFAIPLPMASAAEGSGGDPDAAGPGAAVEHTEGSRCQPRSDYGASSPAIVPTNNSQHIR